jgi:hypothetical protein
MDTNVEFDFMVENMTREQADELLELIRSYTDSQALTMGGGFVIADNPEIGDVQEKA